MSYSSEVLADSPLAYLRLGESAGTTAADSSGNGRNFSITGGVTLGAAGALTGDADTAYTFDGSSGKVSLANAAWQNVSSITLEAWVKTTATGNRSIWDRDAEGPRVFQFRVNTSGKLEFIIISGGNAVCAGATTINNGVYHHVAVTYDGSTIRLYVDGNLDGSLATSLGLQSNAAPLGVGWNGSAGTGGAQHWSGQIDEAAYYGTALSAARIAAHHTAGVSTTVTVVGQAWIGSAVALDGTPQVGLRVNGESWVAAATMLDGAPQVGLRVAGEPAVAVATMLEGTIPVSVPVLVTGESWAAAATALDGTGRLVVTGDVWATSADFLNGNVVGAPIILTGESWAASTVVLDGIAFTPPPLSGLGIGLDSDAALTVDEPLEPEPTVPAGTPPTVLHIITPTVPVPTLVAGRPQ